MKYFLLLLFSLLFLISKKNEAQIIINGDLTESAYQLLSTRLNTNGGFAPDCELTNVYYALLDGNLYLGVECKLQSVPNFYNPLPDGLGIWLNVSSQQGLIAGNPLGIFDITEYHYLNGALEVGGPSYTLEYTADFEVDYMFAVYTDGTTEHIIFDAASHTGSTQNMLQNIGMSNQSGTSASGPSVNGIFVSNSIEFAFQQSNFEGSLKGFEVKIPLSELSATPNDTFELFAPIVSSTAYFSDQTIPGNVLSGNSGFTPDYFANVNSLNCDCPSPGGTIGEGPYHTSSVILPVEFTSFTATSEFGSIIINWMTSTETNNLGFEIERKIITSNNNGEWVRIGFVEGSGTTTEIKSYNYIDDVSDINANALSYRLKQLDYNGSFEYSNEVLVANISPNDYVLEQNYPNPFNPSTTISFGIPVKSNVVLKIFDVVGTEIVTLVNEEKAAGKYEVSFDAKNLASGVYYYCLKTENFFQTKMMILMK